MGRPWSWRPSRATARVACGALGAGCASTAWLEVLRVTPTPAHRWVDVVLALVGTVPLVAIGRAPAAVFALVAGSDYLIWFGRPSWTLTGAVVLPLVAYALAASRGRLAGVVALVTTAAGLVGAVVTRSPGYLADGSWMPALLLCVVAVLAGDAVSAHRSWRAVERLADQRRAVLAERLRVSRDLHDVVAHHLTAIAVQADTAPQRLRGLTDEAEQGFAVVGNAARAALDETRQLVSYLRDSEGEDPTWGRLADLLADAARDGLVVDLRTTGARGPLPPAVGLAAYRVIQEGLTNVRRHSRACTAQVELSRAAAMLTVRIVDPGPAASPTGKSAGFGLIGLRERAEALGGELVGRSRVGGGFEVFARLPLATGRDGAA